MSNQSIARPLKRNGFWYLIRRVPDEFKAHDPRVIVCVSSKIRILDDPSGRRAAIVVAELDRELRQIWLDLRAGRDVDAVKRYAAARKLAAAKGFQYAPAAEAISNFTADEIVRRVGYLFRAKETTETAVVSAVLGGEKAPASGMMVSEMLGEFEGIVSASLGKKSEKQKTKWRVPKQTALDHFVRVIGGDKPMGEVTRADALALRTFWQNRVLANEVEIDTANKYMARVSVMFKSINEHRQLGLGPHFDKLRIGGGVDKQRVAFDPVFVQNRFFADGAFADLNEEARRILYVLAETGLRLSEACNLTKTTIVLDGDVPHVQVRPEGREMKTVQSRRDIPLVGAALQAMRLQPDGFPRYRDNGDSLSALLNKALEVRKLRTVEGQSLYSLRHTFEDRLTAVEAPEKVVASLMGHKWYRPRYGLGPTLEQKQSWLLKIAFRSPRAV